MFNYARSDTHFLLYCFDHVRNELLDHWTPNDPENDKMTHVLQNSKETALRLYEREPYDAVNGNGALGWHNIISRGSESLNPMRLGVFKAVHQWRDTTARIEDESIHYVMPRHQLFNLARKMPIDIAGVLSCCPRPSPPVKIRAGELVVVIRNAKDAPEVREWQKSLEVAAATENATERTAQTSEGRPCTDVFDPTFAQSGAIRAEKSDFWGNCDESSRWRVVSGEKQDEGQLRLAMPLPQLTAAIFVSRDDKDAPEKLFDPGARAEHEYVKRSKRKLEATVMSEAQEVPDIDEDTKLKEANAITPTSGRGSEQLRSTALTPDGSRHREKSRKKKKQEKATGDSAAASPAAENQAFDYASAPSVLNAKPSINTNPGKREGKKEKKPFNPYAGSRNVPKGLSRENKERAGRSSTFKR
jgi:exosome complex exonuclease RRP6